MHFRVRRPLAAMMLVTATIAVLAAAGPASAAITPSRDAGLIAGAIGDQLAPGVISGASFAVIPPAPGQVTQCTDGEDNDDDGKIDTGAGGDPGCPTASDNLEQEDAPPDCSDEVDNDGDGKTDFAGNDAGCEDAGDLSEESEGASLVPECSDGQDNDFDGKTDFGAAADPGCAGLSDNREEDDRKPQCSDELDNDFDGKTDFVEADPGCDTALDDEEDDLSPNPEPECSDGFDNDDDGTTDSPGDAGCSGPADIDESSEGVPLPSAPECSDLSDNDFDDKTDLADPGCSNSSDNQEFDDAGPQCSDGTDNDGDSDTDLGDPGCAGSDDNDEGSDGLPPGEDPNPTAIVNSPLAGLPFSGATWGLLSSGKSTFADDPNTGGSTGQGNGGGGGTHGPSFYDMVTLKVDLQVPANSNCLSVDFRFLSEEYPEYVGSSVNDAFIAELDVSDFSADASQSNKVVAPRNFAFDGQGNPISINTTGASEMSETEAAGTTYDGATPPLRAYTPITAGAHSLYLSIFDQGDPIYDSAVFLDNLVVFSAPAGGCRTGATPDLTPPDTTITAGPTGTIGDDTPTFEFTSTEAGSIFECKVDAGEWTSCSSPETTAALAPGSHTFQVRAIDPAGNVDPSPASRSFTVEAQDTTPPDTAITSGPSGPTNDSTPTFEFNAPGEPGATFECNLDNAGWSACTSPRTTTTLADGAHTFQVRAKDAAGQRRPDPGQPQLHRRHRGAGHEHHQRTVRAHQRQHAELRVQLARRRRELRVPGGRRSLERLHLADHARCAERRGP